MKLCFKFESYIYNWDNRVFCQYLDHIEIHIGPKTVRAIYIPRPHLYSSVPSDNLRKTTSLCDYLNRKPSNPFFVSNCKGLLIPCHSPLLTITMVRL